MHKNQERVGEVKTRQLVRLVRLAERPGQSKEEKGGAEQLEMDHLFITCGYSRVILLIHHLLVELFGK